MPMRDRNQQKVFEPRFFAIDFAGEMPKIESLD